MKYTFDCANCGKTFESGHPKTRCCSDECFIEYRRKRQKERARQYRARDRKVQPSPVKKPPMLSVSDIVKIGLEHHMSYGEVVKAMSEGRVF